MPVILWMAVIFVASSDAFSVPRTSRILGPLLRWIFPGASEEFLSGWIFLIRKAAHAWEYALLSVLCWRALRQPKWGDPRPWAWNPAWKAWLLATAYAATDEWHQSFVPSRGAAVGDVAIDSAGALLGILLIFGVGLWRRRK